jgi:polar amino acid transport system substrate-binding protein
MPSIVPKLMSLWLLGLPVWLSPPGWAADLATITQRGRLVVAVKDNLRPLGFRDTNGQLRGLEIEIAQRLATEILGKPAIDLKPLKNQDRLTAVTSGQVDVAIAHVTASPARARIVSFSTPYYTDGTMLITRQAAMQKLADLKTQKIAVLQGSGAIAQLRYRLPHSELVAVTSYAAGQALLTTGEVAALAADATVLSGLMQTASGYRLLPERLSAEPICIVLPKGLQYEGLRQQINQAIARWQSEGWLRQRAIAWGLP